MVSRDAAAIGHVTIRISWFQFRQLIEALGRIDHYIPNFELRVWWICSVLPRYRYSQLFVHEPSKRASDAVKGFAKSLVWKSLFWQVLWFFPLR